MQCAILRMVAGAGLRERGRGPYKWLACGHMCVHMCVCVCVCVPHLPMSLWCELFPVICSDTPCMSASRQSGVGSATARARGLLEGSDLWTHTHTHTHTHTRSCSQPVSLHLHAYAGPDYGTQHET